MQDRVQDMLAGRYQLWYHPAVDTSGLTAMLTLPQAIQHANTVLEHDTLDRLTEPEQDCLARMVRVKWIYQTLPKEPIRKPILAHAEHDELVVDCGDTRLMALSLLQHRNTVSVLMTNTAGAPAPDWQEITSETQLFQVVGLDPDTAILIYTPTAHNTPWAVSWLEIGDVSTSHHLHDTMQCMDVLLPQLHPGFRFSRDWFYD